MDVTSRPVSVRARAASGVRAVADLTRERAAALNQLLLAAVVLVLCAMVGAIDFPGDLGLFFAGALLVFVASAAALLVPWNRMAPGWVAVIPTADILAVTMMQVSSPRSGFGLLWVFPTMWLAAAFGLIGVFGVVVTVGVLFTVTVLVDTDRSVEFSTFLLPLVVLAVAATSYLTARRSDAQRTLLAQQAQLLHQVLERTRRQEQEVTEVLDAVDFGVIRVGADGSIAVANEAHARLNRHIAEIGDEAASAPYRDDGVTPLPPDELPFARVLRGESFDGEVVWFGVPDGPRRALMVSARRLRDVAGADAGAVLVSRDVTAELSATRARDDLVASVSHELRTPLTAILGYLDLAIDEPGVPDEALRSLEIAERNAERLLAITADILAASSASSTTIASAIAPERVDAAELVRAAAESLQPRAAERSVRFDLDAVEHAMVQADPLRLRQVLDNLIANAIAYNREGGSVTLSTRSDGDTVWITVSDDGIGIPEPEQARLFHRYYRAKTAGRRGVPGTGLGLAISRDIIRAHGGDITVRSGVGTGTTFVVHLPVEGGSDAA